jgi:hypothetical protein
VSKVPSFLRVSMGPADGQPRPPKERKQPKESKQSKKAEASAPSVSSVSDTAVMQVPAPNGAVPAEPVAVPAAVAAPAAVPAPTTSGGLPRPGAGQDTIDLQRRRDQLTARVAELQWDLGGLVYEMAIRDRIRVDVIVRRAAALQNADAELSEVERILRLEETSTAGQCASCGSPHSSGAAYCWQCGQPLLQQVASDRIAQPSSAQPSSAEPGAGLSRTGP